jgi:deoxycytidylate deaminase
MTFKSRWFGYDFQELLYDAYQEATNSPDPSTQNGAILLNVSGEVLAKDHNRLPGGVKCTPERYERPLKYKVTGHAEANVIYQSARQGLSTCGSTLVCPWAACSVCAIAIIQSGVSLLVVHKDARDRSHSGKYAEWAKDIEVAMEMLDEAGVEVRLHSGSIGGDIPVRFDHEIWYP